MKIEIWSDFVCPFCYIGKRKLEQALEKFPERDQVVLEFKSYQLDPDANDDPELNFYEIFSKLKGIPIDQAKMMNEQIGKQAAQIGLTYNFDTMRYPNTLDAHRVAKYADTKGKGAEITERFLYAHFTESKLLSDADTLVELAKEVGLDEEEVREVVETKKFEKKVDEDIDLARQLGVQGVPFFVFNEKYAVSGAQPTETFLSALEKVWEEEKQKPALQSLDPKESKTSYCTDEGCGIE